MHTPCVFIAYTPRGAGLRCAVAYLETSRDVYGWFTGPRPDLTVASGYFLLEDLFSRRTARYEAVDQAALHSSWSLDEARRHELAQMQEAFAHQWLFYRDDPRAGAELQSYSAAELGIGEVNVRFERLAKFSTAQPTWTYSSPGFEQTVLGRLGRRWPLEYRVRAERPEKRRERRIASAHP